MTIIVFIHVNWCRFNTCSVRFGLSDFDETSYIFLFNNSPLSDLDKISYIDSFWDGICEICICFSKEFPSDLDATWYIHSIWNGICHVCICFLEIPHPPPVNSSPFPPKPLPLILNTFPLSYLDETSYIDLFWDCICIFFFRKSPPPEFSSLFLPNLSP